MPKNIKETASTAFAVMVVGFALLLAFGGPVLHGLVDFARWLGAN